jgi:uncharacterized protein DUF2490
LFSHPIKIDKKGESSNTSRDCIFTYMIKRVTEHIIFIFLLLIISFPSFSQSNEKLGSWYIYNGFFNLNPKIELFFETQLRTWEPVNNPESFFVRPYFNYNINKKVQVGLGLEYHKYWTYDEVPENRIVTEEFRTTLQMMVFQNIGRVKLQHRYRYEFRHTDGTTAQRTRYRVQATIPLTTKEFNKGGFFINAFNEFLIVTKPNLYFSQNRFYIATGYQFIKTVHLQVGYLNLLRENSVHHRLNFLITHRLYFYKW